MTLKDRFIKVAEAFYGCQTGDEQQQMIVELYNQIKPLPRGYKLKAGDPWCAAFVSACSYVVAALDYVLPECGAQEMYYAYPEGRTARTGKPAERGDLLFYDWNHDGRADHVGIVLENMSGYLEVIEGNFGGACQIRHIKNDDQDIYGTARPFWGESDERVKWVDCDLLNLRADPSMDAEVILEMCYGDPVTVAAESDGWSLVTYTDPKLGKKNGYCGSGYLADSAPPILGETTTAVYLRADAGTDSKAIAVLPAGTSIFYTGDRQLIGSAIWERVTVDEPSERSGWLNRKYTRPVR